MGYYLPFHSSWAKQGEESRRQLHIQHKIGTTQPGGVWKNIEKKEN